MDDCKLYYQKFSRRDKCKSGDVREVILNKDERWQILQLLHEGGTSIESKSLSSHRGRDVLQRILCKRFFWPNMSQDAKKFVQECPICQKANPGTLKVAEELHPIPIPSHVMKQVGVDIMQLPEVNGKRYVVVAIDYFSKYSEARAIDNKSASNVARFLLEEIICRHGCPSIQINDQGREFCNSVSDELHRLTGVKQRVTSAYHPQVIIELQYTIIKNYYVNMI